MSHKHPNDVGYVSRPTTNQGLKVLHLLPAQTIPKLERSGNRLDSLRPKCEHRIY
jgi:hypothetical protein